MPRRTSPARNSDRCTHAHLVLEPTPHADEVGYRQPTVRQRAAASCLNSSTLVAKRKRTFVKDDGSVPASTFPAPLVLPGDDLALDPTLPFIQSLQSWFREEDRNEVTHQRNVIYVAAPPDVEPDVESVESWTQPHLDEEDESPISAPNIEDVVDYLAAFYHGLPVKLLRIPKLRFTTWDKPVKKLSKAPRAKKRDKKSKSLATPATTFLGLSIGTECVRI